MKITALGALPKEYLKEEFINTLREDKEYELVFYLELQRFLRASLAKYGVDTEYKEYIDFYKSYFSNGCPSCLGMNQKLKSGCYRCLEYVSSHLAGKYKDKKNI